LYAPVADWYSVTRGPEFEFAGTSRIPRSLTAMFFAFTRDVRRGVTSCLMSSRHLPSARLAPNAFSWIRLMRVRHDPPQYGVMRNPLGMATPFALAQTFIRFLRITHAGFAFIT
jgi:hypothetical protein